MIDYCYGKGTKYQKGKNHMHKIIRVEVKDNNKIYPVNDTARKFARLIGKKTFNTSQLSGIHYLGYKIVGLTDKYKWVIED